MQFLAYVSYMPYHAEIVLTMLMLLTTALVNLPFS